MHSLLGALRFLTLLPVPAPSSATDGRVVRWFPLVGMCVGGISCAVGAAAGWLWGESARAIAVVLSLAIVTGGLHLDGLSDTFDAMLSWQPRERKLEIMKDSRIGAMGTLALVAVLALKVVWVVAAGEQWWRNVLLATVVSRWVMAYGLVMFPSARPGGLGDTLRSATGQRDLWIAAAQGAGLAFGVSLIALPTEAFGIALARTGVALASAVLALHLVFRQWSRALGGLTGDTYGAGCELAEGVMLAALSAGQRLGG
ncbi:MAG: adenosylcobinamide-GDP ribazoletransferase [Anaerolineae bacterium]|nr:adenosylcobinamide-GDP ribazoletransferase [Anaerolineae bacterium]